MTEDKQQDKEFVLDDTNLEIARETITHLYGTRLNGLIAEEKKPEEQQDKQRMEKLREEKDFYANERRLVCRGDEKAIIRTLTVHSKIEAEELRNYRQAQNQLGRE